MTKTVRWTATYQREIEVDDEATEAEILRVAEDVINDEVSGIVRNGGKGYQEKFEIVVD